MPDPALGATTPRRGETAIKEEEGGAHPPMTIPPDRTRFACLHEKCGYHGHTSGWARAVENMEAHATTRHHGNARFDVNQGLAMELMPR